MGVNKGRTIARTAVSHGARKSGITLRQIGAVKFFEMKIGKARYQSRNASAGGLYLDWHRDGVAIVFHAEHHRQLAVGGGIHGFPELAFAGGAVAERDIGDLVSAI